MFDNRNNKGFMIACYKNNVKIVELLIERYPNIIE